MVIMCLQHYLLCRESPGSPSGLVVCQKDLQDSAYSHIHGSDLLQKGYKTNPPKKGLWAKSRGNNVNQVQVFNSPKPVKSHRMCKFLSTELWQYMWSAVSQGSLLEALEACVGFPWTSLHASFPFADSAVPFHYNKSEPWGWPYVEPYEFYWIFKPEVVLGTSSTPARDHPCKQTFLRFWG